MSEVPGWDVELVDVELSHDEGDPSHLTVEIDAKNLPSVRLLGVELMALHDDMRIGASPFAERLENIIRRFTQTEGDL